MTTFKYIIRFLGKNSALFFFFIYIQSSYNQTNKIDQFHLDKLSFFTDTNNDSILFYAKKLKKSKKPCNFYHALNMEAKAFYQKGLIVLAEKKVNLVLNEIDHKNEYCFKKNKITALTRLFWIYKNKKQYQKAFDAIIKKINVLESLDIKDNYYHANYLSTQNNLAIIKSVLGFHVESRKILKDMIPLLPKIYSNLNNGDYYHKLFKSSTFNLIAESYLKSSINNFKYLDSASYYFRKAFEVAKTFVPPHKNTETLYYLREAEVFIAKKEYRKSLNLIQKYSKNSKEFNTSQNINSLKAICFFNLQVKDSTLHYSKLYLQNFDKKNNNKKRLIAIYNILSNQYYIGKQLDSAFKYSELTIAELKLLDKSKNEINKSHYLHNYNDIKKLNRSILEKEKNSFNTSIFIISIIILIFVLFFSFMLKKNRVISKNLNAIKKQNSTQKKEYNIDNQLEKEILKGIIDLKRNNYFLETGFNIQNLANQLNTNTSYLSYIINKEFNKSFKEYLIQLRIEYLIEKLKTNKEYKKFTIKSLAEEVGYTNASAFTRAFKKYKGITPSEFIKGLNQ
ncbi:helix-turn-helix domain-containing protein [Polaribacter aquimarinus]|uniref:HTH araC/xylS-type domain-containing protein n=1 Tax=Polaribacter aquimarinus TaxID=2100726 RepID=A0A2U2JDC5_9FLAO|nr:helix-turn-helix domain-containing protein [Polaribacter aquimarinus]PWG06337.1 hypothetical protein DIS07_00455 [Polaribacter aquimarinus]